MSSLPAILTAWPLAPSTHATDTARNAGCRIDEVVAKSSSCVDGEDPQSSRVQNASGSRAQSAQKRGGGGIAGAATDAPGIAPRSPSAISASQDPAPSGTGRSLQPIPAAASPSPKITHRFA